MVLLPAPDRVEEWRARQEEVVRVQSAGHRVQVAEAPPPPPLPHLLLPPPPLPPVPRPGLQCLLRLALALLQLQREQQQSVRALRKRSFVLSSPYACPEPVLVKRSFSVSNGAKTAFLLPAMTACRESAGSSYSERIVKVEPSGSAPAEEKHTQGLFSLQLSFVVVRSLSWQMIVSQQKTTRQ
eukprot:COSAG06_NODE_61_length_27084_cov_48.281490_11_plen_183_part_00